MPLFLTAPPALLTLAATVALVAADLGGWRSGRLLFKPVAAAGFIWLALSFGALDTLYGQWLVAGLALCAVGDVCLMWERPAVFLAGLVAFLLGHVLYAIAFLQWPVDDALVYWTLLPVVLLMAGAIRWLWPHLQDVMRVAVPAYIVVIGSMLLCAALPWGNPGASLILIGAWGFALSDLAVARDRFIEATPMNGVWGTPLYFTAQLFLAASAGSLAL